jgi:putative DNA methylase
MTAYRRKLIEVALPLEAINRESAREKSIRHGHPSTLHLWWARRPLAACRAVLFASLVDDPSAHPERFPTEQAQQEERERLFRIIEELVKWENSTNAEVLKAARAEILASCDGSPPAVLDPFCGGGSIPLEAQRLGLEARGSDLNPVAVLITKALVELPARFAGRPPVHPDGARGTAPGSWEGARGLAEDVRWYGRWMRAEAERRLGHLYPKVTLPPEHGGGQTTVIAWIWARTVRSPNPAWVGPMPLVRSFALSTKHGRETWVQPVVDRERRRIRFEIRSGPGCPAGTVGRTSAVCLATGTPVPMSYVRAEGRAGRMGVQLMAIVAEGPRGRVYLPPDPGHERVAAGAVPPGDLPAARMPSNPRWFSPPGFGLQRFADLFTPRQLLALRAFSDLVGEARERLRGDAPDPGAYGDAVVTYLAFAVDKLADRNSAICAWEPRMDRLRGTFQRQALPMTWDFAEANPFGGAGGDFAHCLFSVWEVLCRLPGGTPGTADQADAAALDTATPALIATDPPYYDNLGYADLSDFFYVWLRRSLRDLYPKLLDTLLTPKSSELVATPYRFDGRERAGAHVEAGLRQAFARMRATQDAAVPLTLFYAFKQVEGGWETMLEALLRAGFAVTGTWPMRTELPSRMLSSGTNALASSIVLVCRPRAAAAPPATRTQLLDILRAELPAALRRLQQGNIAPVDLAQAAIGLGMTVFSRHAKVVEADGSAMTVQTALRLINVVLDEALAEQDAHLDAETRWALAWFQQHGLRPGPFGLAETLSKAKNTAVDGLVATGIVASRAGTVRLLDRDELPARWDPAGGRRPTVWAVAQHLIRALEGGGEAGAAELLRRVGGLGEPGRGLAYRLYTLSERGRWPKEALAYNALVVAWPEIIRLAVAAGGGFDDDVRRAVTENARTLEFDTHQFEPEEE